MLIGADHAGLRYCGRIDFEDAKAPVFLYAGSHVCLRFSGSSIGVSLSNHRSYASNYIGYVLDGVQGKILLEDNVHGADGAFHQEDVLPHGAGEAFHGQGCGNGIRTYCLGEGLAKGEHELLLFKRMDACHYFTLHGFELEEGGRVLPPPPMQRRRMEVFGDSVSCGEVSEAVAYVGKEDPEHDGEFSNSWYSYSWITARKLGAQLHLTSQGGAALLDGTGWFCGPDFVGMESIFDKLQYNPQLGTVKNWDFENWKPHVAVVAIGQNDSNPEDYMAKDYYGEKAENWRNRYRVFVERLMGLYPKARFVLTTTILCHDPAWDRAIGQVCREIGSGRVHHFLYEKNGCGTPGHVRIPEAEKMAEELAAYVTSLGEGIWEDETEGAVLACGDGDGDGNGKWSERGREDRVDGTK